MLEDSNECQGCGKVDCDSSCHDDVRCCATCRFWEADTVPEYGTCEMPDEYDEDYPPDTPAALHVMADDDQGLSVSLLTRASFCCSEHSPS